MTSILHMLVFSLVLCTIGKHRIYYLKLGIERKSKSCTKSE